MAHILSKPEIQQFISDHEADDERLLVLKHKTIMGIPTPVLANQISCRRKAREKLPLWYTTRGIVFPPSSNLEQSSSEATARYKFENILNKLDHTNSVADLTGGFGVDSFFLSRNFKTVQHVEPNVDLLEISKHNHHLLGATNITYHSMTAENFLESSGMGFDLIYIDPSRKSTTNKKLFRFTDCEPDVTGLLDQLFKKAGSILVKASPLLDIQQGLNSLRYVSHVFVVSVGNDCKELLFFCQKNFFGEPNIHATNLGSDVQDFDFSPLEEKSASVDFSEPLTYLYEPNASILKAGAFKRVGEKFNLFKLHQNTHIYTSSRLISNFPGRVFKTNAFAKVPDLKKLLPEGKANIIVRNYPLSVEEIRKKTRIKEGGENYLIALTALKKKCLVIASRIK